MSNYKSMEKKKQQWRAAVREHLVAFGIALLLVVWGLSLFSKNGWSLLADITSFGSQSGAQVVSMPIVYEITDWVLSLHTTKEFSDIQSIQFFVIYDEKNVILQVENATSPYELTYAGGSKNMLYVTLFPRWNVAWDTQIYTLPLNGKVDGVVVSDLSITRADNRVEKIALQKK